MSRCQRRPPGRPAGTEAKRRPLTTTVIVIKHNDNRPPARAGLQAHGAARSAAHTPLFTCRCSVLGWRVVRESVWSAAVPMWRRGPPAPVDTVVAMTQAMRARVRGFLDSLNDVQRGQATAEFDAPDHRQWTYLPGERPGLKLAEMTVEQREVVLSILDIACGAAGAMTARAVIDLDLIRRRLDGEPAADDDRYWVRVLGDPRAEGPWAWRLNGHHLAIHVTVVGDEIAATPQFFGAEPAVVPDGPHRGLRTLPGEEELARAVLARLDPPQRAVAITSDVAPDDILTRHDPIADPTAVPPECAGLS